MSDSHADLSWRTLGVGAVLGIVFAGTAMYAGTKIGYIDAGNIAAALLAFAILSAISRARPSASEGNIVQTVSSSAAAMSITGGMLGPVAALSISGRDWPVVGVAIWGIALGVLGCLFAMPLRVAFVERGSLRFPSGTATAEIIDAIYTRGRSAAGHLRLLAIGGALAAAFTFARTYLGWIPEMWVVPMSVGAIPAANIALGVGWSPLLVGVGALAGIRTGVALVLGSAIAWVVLAPQLVAAEIAQPDYVSLLNWLLWPGTGLMIGGSLGSVVGAWRDLRASFDAVRASGGELGARRTYVIVLVATMVAIVVLGHVVFGVHSLISIMGIALSAILCAAAARATGETDTTPAGPLGGFAQIVTGSVAPGGVDAPLTAGGIVNGSLSHSSMLLQNWRTGHIVHTRPQRQLIAQLVGVVVGAIACAGAFELIRQGYGLGTEAMPAMAAQSWKATAEVVQHGTSAMPAYAPAAVLAGFLTGIVLAVAQKRITHLPSPIAMGMAFILPPYMSITMAIGGLIWWLVARKRRAWTDEYGLSAVSGLIAGEALAGLTIAALLVAGVRAV